MKTPDRLRRSIKAISVAAAFLALAAAASAQKEITTSPPGWESREGHGFALVFGTLPQAHYQFADAEFKGKGVKFITGVGYRHDWSMYDPAFGTGRKWAKVTLRLSDCHYDNLSPTFSQNPSSAPTKLFETEVSWPSIAGFPERGPSGPAQFNAALAFPLDAPWAYMAKKAILLDYVFEGGTLANHGLWGPGNEAYYRLDSVGVVTHNLSKYVAVLSSHCRDSGQAIDAYLFNPFHTYAANTGSKTTSNKMMTYTTSHYTARNAMVVHAMGTRVLTNPIAIPGWCGQLWIDTTAPTFYVVGRADVFGYFGSQLILGRLYFGYHPSLVGQSIWVQPAWRDSVTAQVKIGRGVHNTIPPQPVPTKRKMQYALLGNKVGNGFSAHYFSNPIPGYTYR